MSGGRPFSEPRLRALCDLAVDRWGGLAPSAKLEVFAWRCDFEYFARHGESLTGATWVKGIRRRPVFIREVGPYWFDRYVRERCGLLASATGRALAFVIVAYYALRGTS